MQQPPRLLRATSAFALAAAAVHAPVALAQAESDGLFHDGRWTAQLELSEAGFQRASVVLADYGGTWQDTTPSLHASNKACAGKKFAITVQRSRTTVLEFMVWGSSVSPTCPDLQVLLKPQGAKTLEGTIGNAGKLRLTRR